MYDLNLNQILSKLLEQAPPAVQQALQQPLSSDYDLTAIEQFRSLFPSYQQQPDLIYLDSAATSLRPQVVANSFLDSFSLYGNIERSSNSSALNDKIQVGKRKLLTYLFPNTEVNPEQLVYTSGTTEAINLIANGLANYWQQQLATISETKIASERASAGSQTYYILVSGNNHNSNLLPWLQLSKRLPQIRVLAINFTQHPYLKLKQETLLEFKDDAEFLQNYAQADLASILAYLKHRVLLISASSVTNVTADIENLAEISRLQQIYSPDSFLLVDHAQGTLFHNYQQKLNQAQQQLGWDSFDLIKADFVVTSLHKMLGLTGIGVLYCSNRIMQLQDSFTQRALDLLAQFNLVTTNPEEANQELAKQCFEVNTNQRSLNRQFKQATNYLQPTLLGGGVVDFLKISPQASDYKLASGNPFAIAGTSNLTNLATVADTIDFLAQYQNQEAQIYHYQTQLVQQAYQQIREFRELVLMHNPLRSGSQEAFLVYDVEIIPTQVSSYHLCLQLVNQEDLLDTEVEFNSSLINSQDLDTILPAESLESFLPNQLVYRSGKHCAYQLFNYLNCDGCYRFSFAYYNTPSELEQVVNAVKLYLAQNLFL